MSWIFTLCAVVGGTVLVCQLILLVTGITGHDDVAGAGHDVTLDHADAHALPAAGKEYHPGLHAPPAMGPSLLVCMLGLRGIIAALTFFGLGGLIVQEAGGVLPLALLGAVLLGLLAMGLVGLLTRTLVRLRREGTLNIAGAVGRSAVVYLSIPARKSGKGKITVELQNRSTEYPAVTAYPEDLPAGAEVTVLALLDGDTLEVIPAGFDRAAETRGTSAPPVS